MKILVTGGLGYLGSDLIRYLPFVFPKAELIILENLLSGKHESLLELRKPKQYHLIEEDIRSYRFENLGLGPDDCVIHLAALSRPEKSFDNKKDYLETNYNATVRLAKVCEKAGASLFFPSSTSVHGRTDGGWIKGCDQFLNPSTPYAVYKLKAEKALYAMKKLRFTIARFGTVYGYAPGVGFHTVVNKFCWQAWTQQPITVWETAWDQYRPYLDIQDVTTFLLTLLRKREFSRQTYHVTSDQATVAMIVKMIQKRIPEIEVRRISTRAMNHLSYKIPASPLDFLGYKPRGSLQEGIDNLINIFERISGTNKRGVPARKDWKDKAALEKPGTKKAGDPAPKPSRAVQFPLLFQDTPKSKPRKTPKKR